MDKIKILGIGLDKIQTHVRDWDKIIFQIGIPLSNLKMAMGLGKNCDSRNCVATPSMGYPWDRMEDDRREGKRLSGHIPHTPCCYYPPCSLVLGLGTPRVWSSSGWGVGGFHSVPLQSPECWGSPPYSSYVLLEMSPSFIHPRVGRNRLRYCMIAPTNVCIISFDIFYFSFKVGVIPKEGWAPTQAIRGLFV